MRMLEANGERRTAQPRLLAVDDDGAVTKNWNYLLSQHVELVAAGSFEEAWSATDAETWRANTFDYVFLDLQLPDGNGADLLDRVNALEPRPGVAVISGYIDAHQALAIHGRCAIAVPKPADREVLLGVLAILDEARSGGSLIESFASEYQLSPQETRLLLAAAREASNEEAADELGCTNATVRSYWRRIFEKTGRGSAREVITHLLRFALAPKASPSSRTSSRPAPPSQTMRVRSPVKARLLGVHAKAEKRGTGNDRDR
jgi:DNA-binding NarL/FixJ family response regulator